MYLPRKKIESKYSGFAIVAAISILSLLVMLALAFVSLATQVSRFENDGTHRDRARANARLALAEALSLLQATMGKDQSVCAEAAIIESPNDPSTAQDETAFLKNRHWLGAWKTSYTHGGREWPVVGKLPDIASDSSAPYQYKGIYNDLRNGSGNWKEDLFQGWLVSGDPTFLQEMSSSDRAFSGDLTSSVKMVGEYFLANGNGGNEVIVPLVDIHDSAGPLTGRYGFWVSNNNLKANIASFAEETASLGGDREVSVKNDPGAVLAGASREDAFDHFFEDTEQDFYKIISYDSLSLGFPSARDAFKEKFHDFTNYAYGMQVNVQQGGFKRDLTPLLLGERGKETVNFPLPLDTRGVPITDHARYPFCSDFGIIPGERHGVINPTFDALRDWGQLSYMPGLAAESVEAEYSFSVGSVKLRNGLKWARGISDGYAVEPSKWAAGAPKVHPVMTEASWHMGFSYKGTPPDSNFRFHLAPRVVLWNPYAVKVKMPKMAVLLPNAFKKYNNLGIATADDTRVKFLVEDEHAEALKAHPSLTAIPEVVNWSKATEAWNSIGAGASGSFYSFSVNSNVFGAESWAPRNRYLAFEIEATEFKPGQCLVFSPKVRTDVEVAGVDTNLKKYDEARVSNNTLSAREQFGYDHFISESEFPGTQIRVGSLSAASELTVEESEKFFQHIDFSKVFRYRMTGSTHMNPHAILKHSRAGEFNVSGDTMASSPDFLTVQTINCGQGGTEGGEIQLNNIFVENVNTALEDSDRNPRIRFPRRFQMGVKLAWLDESGYEGNAQESYRHHPTTGFKDGGDSVFFKPAIIAYGNVRSSIITRAPHQFTYASLYAYGAGSWMASYASPSPSEIAELPLINSDGLFTKNPFGSASQLPPEGRAVMFDLPDPEYGTLSLGALRHAGLSPFSWHPSYIVGNSLLPLSAPSAYSAHPVLEERYRFSSYEESTVSNSFDYWVGGVRRPNASVSAQDRYWGEYPDHSTSVVTWGAATGTNSQFFGLTNNESLLSNGSEAITKNIVSTRIDSEDEILDYDISYEVNQNLFDAYFISGMKVDTSSLVMNWSSEEGLHQSGYRYNPYAAYSMSEASSALEASPEGLAFGFWNNGYLFSSEAQFNVNSVSVDAWTAVLSGTRNRGRETQESNLTGASTLSYLTADVLEDTLESDYHVVSRIKKPIRGDRTEDQSPYAQQAYDGSRVLTDQEVRLLAECIVFEVKSRGPFLSLADFVNRRLGSTGSEAERMGALESAIQRSGLNANIEIPAFNTTTNLGTPNGRYQYNVANAWKPDYTLQVNSLTWGSPSSITQGDILSPIAPQLAVRGETYTVRAYGQSVSKGKIVAEAYLEVTVVRTPEYMQSLNLNGVSNGVADRATKASILIDAASGKLTANALSAVNKKWGRRFKIISMRWMDENEI